MATRDDNPIPIDHLRRLAKRGSMVQAWVVRSMAQELLRLRQQDQSPTDFTVTPAERKIVETIREMADG